MYAAILHARLTGHDLRHLTKTLSVPMPVERLHTVRICETEAGV
jgi:hypothetical protein